jgi:hypothetical protein
MSGPVPIGALMFAILARVLAAMTERQAPK